MTTYNPNDFYPSSDAQVKSDGTVAYLENTQGTLLPSQARTAAASIPIQTNYNAKGVIITLNVTAASGTGGLYVVFNTVDPVTNNQVGMNGTPASLVTATGSYLWILYPGATNSNVQSLVKQVLSLPLPKSWSVTIGAADSTSYTYSVGYELIL